MKTPEHYQHLNEHQEKSIAIQYVKHHPLLIMMLILLVLGNVLFFNIGYTKGINDGKQQIISQIGLATYNQVKQPIWIDTIGCQNEDSIYYHFDTILTYIITKGKENGEDNSYSVTLPEGEGCDFLTLQQTDSILQGYEVH